MSRAEKCAWIWRVAVLAALLWVGFEVRQARREIPGGMPWNFDSTIEGMAKSLQEMEKTLNEIRRWQLR